MSDTSRTETYLVSSCLVGLCTRYDGKTKQSDECLNKLKTGTWIPVCPEQLGGLPTPREAAYIVGGNGDDVLSGQATVMSKSGTDLSAPFIKGAEQVLKIAQSQKITSIFFKAKSPSCGVNTTLGVTTALLQKHGFDVLEF